MIQRSTYVSLYFESLALLNFDAFVNIDINNNGEWFENFIFML